MATASLGRLTLDLVAKISGYTEPLSRAERETRKSTKAIAESFDLANLAVKGFSTVVGGLSVASVVAYSEKVINVGNDIQKFAKLANSSVSQFQYYAKGAETAGISLESFADKMKDMQDRIGEFQQTGGGPLADFFTNIAPRVGVTIQQFQKLSGPEALQLFYNSLEKAGASTNDMKFYMEAIISDSSLLIPLLENGSAGFKKWGDAAKDAGAIMSDDMVKSLTEAKMNLQLLDLQWQGLQATLVNNVIPVVENIVENWDKVESGATALAAVIGTRLALSFGIAGAQAAGSLIQYTRYQVALAHMAGETITLTTVTRGLGGAMLSLVGGPLGLIALGVQVAIAGGTYYAMTRKTEDATDAFDIQGQSLDSLIGKYKTLNILQRDNETKALADQYDNLGTKFVVASSDLSAFMEALPISDEKITTYSKLADQFKNGQLTGNAFYQAVKNVNGMSDEQLNKVRALIDAYSQSKTKFDQVKVAQDALKQSADQVSNSQKDQISVVNESAKAWMSLTQKQREYITQLNQDSLRASYIKELVSRGFTTDRANAYAEAQSATNGENAYKVALPDQVKIATDKSFNSKNYTFTKTELAAIAKVNGIAAKNNFAKIEGLYGLPKGTLAAYVLGESGGNANAVSPTGATGLFQTTGIFRKQYGLSKNSSVEAQATAVADAIAKGIDEFGNLPDALRSLNAGIAGTKQYLTGNIGNGKGEMSPAKAKEVAGYVPKFAKNYAGVNGKTTVDQSLLMPSQADLLAQQALAAQSQKELDDMRKEIDAQYYSEAEKLAKEHQDRIEKITQAYAGTKELKTRLDQEDALYKEQTVQLEVNREKELNQLKAFETDRITQIRQSYDEEIRLMEVSTKYFGADREERIKLLERAKQAEIDAVKRAEDEQVQSAFEAYLNETEIVVKRYQREREEILKTYSLSEEARKKISQSKDMEIFSALNRSSNNVFQYGQNAAQALYQRNDPNGFARMSLQDQYSTEMGGLNNAYTDQVSGINAAINDENERNTQLLAAHEQYLQEKQALNNEYAAKEDDLNVSIAENQLNAYNNILSSASSLFSNMTSMAKDAYGESSGAYKAMFLMQQGIAIGQATINAFLAYSQVLAQAPYPLNLTLAPVALGLGMANVGMIASQTITGMAHNGIDNIPKEGTWLLDGGERVLNPQQNKDLTNYLNNHQSNSNSGGNIQISVSVTDSGVSTSGGNTQDQKQLGTMIGNAVRAVIRQEQRQGGLLSK